MKVSEFEFIRKLMNKLPKETSETIIGVGDDASVIKLSENNYLLATTDSQVDGVHFLSQFAAAHDIGRKSVAVNVSDIAAMGGTPTYCLVSLILPKTLDEAYADSLYEGIIEECMRYEVAIIGGNISSGQELIVDIFMLGKTTPSKLLRRKGAKPGDKILVTGSFGEAAAGLQLLNLYEEILPNPPLKKEGIPPATIGRLGGILGVTKARDLLSRQFTPKPRLKEAQVIADSGLATSMIDVSDGLGADMGHICESSKVGVKIYEEKIPVSNAVREVAEKIVKRAWELALNGGEDYELMFTAPESAVRNIIYAVKQETGTDVSVIGEILPKDEGKWLVLKNCKRIPLPVKGWDHLDKT